MQKKKQIRIYKCRLTHDIGIRCKQSDIFGKFMYLRHWVILSHFGEIRSRTHTLRLSAQHIMRNISIERMKQRYKQEVTRNKEQSEQKNVFDVKPTKKICLVKKKKFLSRVVRLMLYTMGLANSVDCLTFYAMQEYVRTNFHLFIRSFVSVFFIHVKIIFVGV